MKADIYTVVKEVENLHGAWLARVDLTRLGLTAIWKRKMGEMQYVYLKSGNQDVRSPQTK